MDPPVIHSFNTYFLDTYYVPGTIYKVWNNVSVNKTKLPALFALHSREGERQIINNKDNKEVNSPGHGSKLDAHQQTNG